MCKYLRLYCFLYLVLLDCSAQLASELLLTAQLFQIEGEKDVRNVKLAWGPTSGLTGCMVVRRRDASDDVVEFTPHNGNVHDEYALPDGRSYFQIQCEKRVISNEAVVEPFTPASGYTMHSNTAASPLDLRSSHIQAGGQAFEYTFMWLGSPESFHILANGVVVLKASSIYNDFLRSPVPRNCFLEAIKTIYNPKTNEVVMWAHLEEGYGYEAAKLLAAHGLPGEPMTVSFAGRPLGYESRDMDFFIDTTQEAYIISSANGNNDINIYLLSPDWTNVESLKSTILKEQKREAPSVVQVGDSYYLFTSQAAGWYPSAATYIIAKDMGGPWSDQLILGDLALFGSQSGKVQQVGSDYAMVSNIWGNEWMYPTQPMPAHEVDRQLLLPLSFTDGRQGVHAHFYPTVMYKDVDGLPAGRAMYGVQAGRILSRAQPVFQGGFGDGRETDGRSDSNIGWIPGQPESLSVLGVNLTDATMPEQGYAITAVELHFTTTVGSEMFYNVIIGARHKDGRPLDDTLLLGPGLFKMTPGFQHYNVSSGSATFHEVRFYFGQALKMSGYRASLCAALVEVTIYGL